MCCVGSCVSASVCCVSAAVEVLCAVDAAVSRCVLCELLCAV